MADLRTKIVIRMGYDPATEIQPLAPWRLLHAMLQLYKRYQQEREMNDKTNTSMEG